MKKLVMLSIVLTAFSGLVYAQNAGVPTGSGTPTPEQKAELKSDREATTAACQAEAQAAGCSDKVVGKGLLKCIHTYKKSHKDFQISDGCKSAAKELKHDRQQYKGKKNH